MVLAGAEKGWKAGQGNEDPFVCETRRCSSVWNTRALKRFFSSGYVHP